MPPDLSPRPESRPGSNCDCSVCSKLSVQLFWFWDRFTSVRREPLTCWLNSATIRADMLLVALLEPRGKATAHLVGDDASHLILTAQGSLGQHIHGAGQAVAHRTQDVIRSPSRLPPWLASDCC